MEEPVSELPVSLEPVDEPVSLDPDELPVSELPVEKSGESLLDERPPQDATEKANAMHAAAMNIFQIFFFMFSPFSQSLSF